MIRPWVCVSSKVTLDDIWGESRYASSLTGRSSAWLERLVWDQEVAGSNPVAPMIS